MASNQKIFDSAIANRTYCSRAVSNVGANGSNNLFLTHPDGNLYCLSVLTGFDLAEILQSADNGFSWEPVTKSTWGSSLAHLVDVTYRSSNVAEGLIHAVFKNSHTGDFYYLTSVNGQIWYYRCSDQTYDSFYSTVTVKYGTFSDLANQNYFATSGDGDTLVYMAYINTSNDLKMLGLDVALPIEYIPQDFQTYGTTDWCSGVLAIKSKDALVHTLAVRQDNPDVLCYIPFTKKQGGGTGSFGTSRPISSGLFSGGGVSSHIDLAIDVDKQSNICAVYSKRDANPGTTITGYYAISNDAGVTWTSIYNEPPAGYSGYVDPATGKVTLYNDVIGGASGSFLISSIYMYNNSGTLFVKEIPSTVVDNVVASVKNVIVGESGVTFSSGDTSTWINSTSNTIYNINSVVYESGLFCAVGDSGLVITSNNSTTWTQRTSNTTYDLNSIAYNNSGMFCAVGDSGTIITSSDCISWTLQTGALTNNLYSVCNWNPIYMWTVAGTLGEFQTSNDGITWTSRSTGQTSYNWYGLAANTTTLVAVGEAGIIRTTANGTTWNNRTSNTTYDLNSALWTGSSFVAAGNNGTIRTNPSGISTWTTQASGTTQHLKGLSYGNSKVNLFGNGGYYATSLDGSGSWSTVNVPISGNLKYFASGYFPASNVSTDAWRRVNTVDGKVIGGKFFKYMGEAIPEFGDKSAIRMAYQIGEINNNYGNDTVKSRIYHEKLTNLAFPQSYSGTAFTKDDIDYYASGYINKNTQLYIDKINELGMVYSISKYEPSIDSEIIGIGAYGQPTTFEFEACVDPGSYSFASVARNDSDFSDYIERDTRKIFYKANLYLPRTFILNKGGYLKRTIYTVRIMGNDYELAQIVPRFLDGSILYYEANLYVIGPSNDPFKKVILPSES